MTNQTEEHAEVEASWVSDAGAVTITSTLGGATLVLSIPSPDDSEAAEIIVNSFAQVVEAIGQQMANCPECGGAHQGGQHG